MAKIETKVQVAGLSATVSGIVLWALSTYVFRGTVNPGIVSLIYAAVPGILAFGAAYIAPHTPRQLPAGLPTAPAQLPTGTVTPLPPSRARAPDPPAPLPPPTGGQI